MSTATSAVPRLVTPQFVVLGAAGLAYFFADGILVPAVPRYVAGELTGGNIAVGLVVAAFSLSALVLRPWAGRLVDRRGRSIAMVGGLLVSSIVSGRIITATGFWKRFLVGGMVLVIAGLLLLSTIDARTNLALVALFACGFFIGQGVGPLVFGALLHGLGPRTALLVIAVAVVVLGRVVVARVIDRRPATPAAA